MRTLRGPTEKRVERVTEAYRASKKRVERVEHGEHGERGEACTSVEKSVYERGRAALRAWRRGTNVEERRFERRVDHANRRGLPAPVVVFARVGKRPTKEAKASS